VTVTARSRRVAAGAVLLLAAAAGCRSTTTASDPGAEPGSAASSRPFRSVTEPAAVPPPVRVRIDAIGVDAPVEDVGVTADGAVAVPRRWDDVGWYAGGPRPGEPGPAVLLGHVDSTAGPAVFYRLRSLRSGAGVTVQRADGSRVRFRVTRVARYPKAGFPTAGVYLPTLRPELRLVTCGGAFDTATGHYVDNVIAYAVLQP
jgi:hypothetical protein